jgi:hypothetical protein
MSTMNHPPQIVYLMLCVLGFVGSMLFGYDTSPNKGRNWFHLVVFAAIMTFAVYVIVDLEYPRVGLIRVDAADQLLIELRKSMQ